MINGFIRFYNSLCQLAIVLFGLPRISWEYFCLNLSHHTLHKSRVNKCIYFGDRNIGIAYSYYA